MKKKIITVIITILLTIVGSYALAFICRPVEIDGNISAIRAFHEMPKDSFDVIAYGSSHTFRGFDPTTMYEEYGISSYNYGCNWQKINTTRYFIEDSLRTQNPKVILVETYIAHMYEENVYPDAQISYTMSMETNTDKIKYLKECFGTDINKWFSYYFPLCAFHDNWKGLCKESFSLEMLDTAYYHNTMGFSSSDSAVPITIADCNSVEQKELSERSLEILQEIVDICNEKGIDVIFYTTPYNEPYEYCNAMQEFCDKNNCKYFNFFENLDETGINGETDFSDGDHLNSSGAQKISSYLGNYIKNNYDLVDYRTIENNNWLKGKNFTKN